MAAQGHEVVRYQEFQNLVNDVSDMKSLMSKIVDAINRIALLDERQQNTSAILEKLDTRMSAIEASLRSAEIRHATQEGNSSRIATLETALREVHVERERDKARFDTAVWMIRGIWAVLGSSIIGGVVFLLSKGAGL